MMVILMNKNYIKLCLVIITTLLSFYTFLSTRYENSTVSEISVLLSLIFSLPIVMHCEYRYIKKEKIKTLYLTIMIILYFISFAIISLLLIEIINNQIDIFIKFDTCNVILSNLLFMTTSWLMIFTNFIDIDNEEETVKFIITIFALLTVISVHINYYINPNLKTIINESTIGEKALYITQNYIYFGIMYVLILISKLNKKI